MASKKPSQPPSFAADGIIKRIDLLSKKVLNEGFTSNLPGWKRWVGGENEYDSTGLRDVVNANAIMLDSVKGTVDENSTDIVQLKKDVQALKEAPAPHPFP